MRHDSHAEFACTFHLPLPVRAIEHHEVWVAGLAAKVSGPRRSPEFHKVSAFAMKGINAFEEAIAHGMQQIVCAKVGLGNKLHGRTKDMPYF
jgi:hypothetical protein